MENSLTFRKKADTSISVRSGWGYSPSPYSENSGFRIFPSASTPNEILKLLSLELLSDGRICLKMDELISLPEKYSIPTSAAKLGLSASR